MGLLGSGHHRRGRVTQADQSKSSHLLPPLSLLYLIHFLMMKSIRDRLRPGRFRKPVGSTVMAPSPANPGRLGFGRTLEAALIGKAVCPDSDQRAY